MTFGSTYTVVGPTKKHSIQSIFMRKGLFFFLHLETSSIFRYNCTSCNLYSCYHRQWKSKGVGISQFTPWHWKWDCDYQKKKEKKKNFKWTESINIRALMLCQGWLVLYLWCRFTFEKELLKSSQHWSWQLGWGWAWRAPGDWAPDLSMTGRQSPDDRAEPKARRSPYSPHGYSP